MTKPVALFRVGGADAYHLKDVDEGREHSPVTIDRAVAGRDESDWTAGGVW